MKNRNLTFHFFLLTLLVPVITILFTTFGCSNDKILNDYEALKESSTTEEELVKNISSFELLNPNRIEPKLDLAKFYLIRGNYKEGAKYLTQAESIVEKSSKRKIKPEQKADLYGMLAAVFLINNNSEKAWDYIQKTLSIKKYGESYGYLAARIQTARGNNKEALELFNKTYGKFPSTISAEELRAYMYLLAKGNEISKCCEIIEKYFETGAYFPGLGQFASAAYEKNNEYEKSIFCAFLDYEYQSCFGHKDDEKFLQNMESLRPKLHANQKTEKALNAINCIESLYTVSPFTKIDSNFFIYKYIELKHKSQNELFSKDELESFLKLEKYFSTFPVYYWTVWESVRKTENFEAKNWISVLNKIISLGEDSIYYSKARTEIGNILGFSEHNSQ